MCHVDIHLGTGNVVKSNINILGNNCVKWASILILALPQNSYTIRFLINNHYQCGYNEWQIIEQAEQSGEMTRLYRTYTRVGTVCRHIQ